MIQDSLGRTFKTLRISLTNTCNLACTYCVNDEVKDVKSDLKKETPLTIQEINQISIKLHKQLNLESVRLTGGEPTLFHEIVPLIKLLSKVGPKIKLTTNGFLLKNLITKLEKDDLHSINISFDALDEDVFFQISKRRSVNKIIEGIEAALSKGIEIKLNCVVINGLNTSQIIPLMKFSNNRGIKIRFLELMKMGHIYEGNFDSFYSEEQILETITSKYNIEQIERTSSSTANYWKTSEGQVFGIIANESSPFCHDCNRLRLDSYGNIYGCLSSNTPINIHQIIDNELIIADKLNDALLQKQQVKFIGSNLSMLEIGG